MARRPFAAPPSKDTGPRVNEDIDAPKIRLVGADGEMVGVVTVKEGIEAAMAAGLDLVEVSPNAEPPVCKVLDYGKYKYELQKKKAEAKKKQKVVDVKEIKMRPGIDEHDYQVKLKAATKFLSSGDKVKVTIRFRGRELSRQELGMEVLRRFQADLEEMSKIELTPKMEGRQMIMVLASTQ